MNGYEGTAFITALANALACRMTDDQLNLTGTALIQLADTLLTVAAYRSASDRGCGSG